MYNTLDALAVAVAAYRHNDNSYVKDNKYTFDYEQDTNKSEIKTIVWANKLMLRYYYNVDVYSNDASINERPPLLKVTDEDRAKAEDIRKFTKKLLFKAMAFDHSKGEYPPYDVSIFQKVNQDEVKANDFGFIASAPFYYENEVYRNAIAERMAESQHVGQIGGRVSLVDLEVTKTIWSNNFQTYIIQGLCDNNLYFFFTNIELKQKEKITLTASIKDHMMEKDKYPMTRLKYVRIKGKENVKTPQSIQSNDLSNLLR